MTSAYGFVGGGNMATAILGGLLKKGVCTPDQVLVSDISAERREFLAGQYGVRVTADNAEVVAGSGCIVLAIKPQTLATVAPEIAAALSADKTIISILAGVRSDILREKFGGHARLVRTMPNLPATVALGVTGIGITPPTPGDAYEQAERLLGTVGATLRVEEDLIDAVTAISGSGPGYVFRIADILVRAGVAVGLSEEASDTLVRQTLRGAAEMLSTSAEPASELCRRVCSPGGTTLAGLDAMMKGGLETALSDGVHAARDRSTELSKG